MRVASLVRHPRLWRYEQIRPGVAEESIAGNISADEVESHAAALQQRNYSIHFHCWTADELRRQIQTIIERFQLPARVASHRTNHHEFLVTLKRAA